MTVLPYSSPASAEDLNRVTTPCARPSIGVMRCSQLRSRFCCAAWRCFRGGCTLDTVEAVCSGERSPKSRTLDLLSSLVSKSLVVAETTGRTQARYRLLETIREYALEKLDRGG